MSAKISTFALRNANEIYRMIMAKKLQWMLLLLMVSASMMNAKNVNPPTVHIQGDLSKYKYIYVIPVSGDKPAPGVPVNPGYIIYSRNFYPSDIISGYLMKFNYTILPECSLEHADSTLIVSYGFTGRRLLSMVKSACTVFIQMSDAQTREIVASFEAEGAGYDESFAMVEAIYTDLELFQYGATPSVKASVAKCKKKKVKIELTNKTATTLHAVHVKLIYRTNGAVVHEQSATIGRSLQPRQTGTSTVLRDASVVGKGYDIEVQVVGYE